MKNDKIRDVYSGKSDCLLSAKTWKCESGSVAENGQETFMCLDRVWPTPPLNEGTELAQNRVLKRL